MSIATIGAVAATGTELLIPGIPQIPYALLLTGAGGTTEVIEVRSLQRGGHVYVTRGAFGSLPVAHTAPVVVTLYDPNSGGDGGGVTLLTAEIPLTDADIKAFGTGTHYVDVVPAPGPGKFVMFHRGMIVIDATATAYGGVDVAAYIDFEYHGGSGASQILGQDGTGSAVTELLGGDGEVSYASFYAAMLSGGVGLVDRADIFDASELENLPLAVYGSNAAAGPFTGGNAANSGRAKVWYTIEDLP